MTDFENMTVEDLKETRRFLFARVIMALVTLASLSIGLNIYLWDKARDTRYFYEQAVIVWVKTTGAVQSKPEYDQMLSVVKKSRPVKIEEKNESVDFGFRKDPSGLWSTTR